ncbi:MAG: ribonuclease HII [Eubacteriales bacterium]
MADLQNKLIEMSRYENELYSKGIKNICGIDEVGRGPLAGPVLACAIILPEDFSILGVDDSKKLSEKKRNDLYDKILSCCISYGVGIVHNRVIDEINILNATKMAMRIAIENLDVKPGHLLIDALELQGIGIPMTPIIKGDTLSVSIAAASIVAKVIRDRMMRDYHLEYPNYAFDSNKGYGTKAHYEGIDGYGICEIHRRSFLKSYCP